MKSLIVFFVAIFILIGFKVVYENDMPNYDFEKLVIVTNSDSSFDSEKINNGNHFYYTFDNIKGKKVLKNLNMSEIEGLVYYFEKDFTIDKIKSKLDFCYSSQEKIDNLNIFYGYDSSYPDFRYVEGKKVNVQIVENATNFIVGYPMILCGY